MHQTRPQIDLFEGVSGAIYIQTRRDFDILRGVFFIE
jgi:hypothetical protein